MGAFLLNCFAVRLLPLVDRTALLWSLLGFGVISITLLATASPHYEVKVHIFLMSQLLITWVSYPERRVCLSGLSESDWVV
jgi:hypothetical protein